MGAWHFKLPSRALRLINRASALRRRDILTFDGVLKRKWRSDRIQLTTQNMILNNVISDFPSVWDDVAAYFPNGSRQIITTPIESGKGEFYVFTLLRAFLKPPSPHPLFTPYNIRTTATTLICT